MRSWLLVIYLFCGLALGAQVVYPFANFKQQSQFNELTKALRCLVCQNEDLADSTAPLAQELRQKIYHMVLAGQSNQQIKAYMVARYGDFILFKPPLQLNTLLLWCAPAVFLLISVVVLFRLLFASPAAHSVGDNRR